MTKISETEKELIKSRDDLVEYMESLGVFTCKISSQAVPTPQAFMRISYDFVPKKEKLKGNKFDVPIKEGEDVTVRVIFDKSEGHSRMTVFGNLEGKLKSHESVIRAARLYDEIGNYGRTHGTHLERESTDCGIPIERYSIR